MFIRPQRFLGSKSGCGPAHPHHPTSQQLSFIVPEHNQTINLTYIRCPFYTLRLPLVRKIYLNYYISLKKKEKDEQSYEIQTLYMMDLRKKNFFFL